MLSGKAEGVSQGPRNHWADVFWLKKGMRIVKILDIFSWLSANELSLEKIENIVINCGEGNSGYDGYRLQSQIPERASENVTSSKNELISEGKKVCYLIRIRDGEVVAVVGYK